MSDRFGNRRRVWLYAATTFLSALLLFQIQPMISKAILPWFGGSPAVWTTAMLFFQTVLFGGYAYAHFAQRLQPRVQASLHAALILFAIAVFPVLPGAAWKPVDGMEPVARILIVLMACVGVPYFVLSATGPLLQAWFARDYPGRSPYRFYSLSNLGSLLALLTYPFLIEPALTLPSQAKYWEIGFVFFGLLCGALAFRSQLGHRLLAAHQEPSDIEMARPTSEAGGLAVAESNSARETAPSAGDEIELPGIVRRVLWIALPALASATFLSATNHVCQDVAVIPFLWVVPLSLYLLTFIICFDHERWYVPRLYAATTLLVIVAITLWMIRPVRDVEKVDSIQIEAGLSFAGMFLGCMLCHGELIRLRPNPRRLTMFYLSIAAGGALGGLLVGVVAPFVFSAGYTEWPIALLASSMLAIAVLIGTESGGLLRRHSWLFGSGLALMATGICLGAAFGLAGDNGVIDARRNFYGVVSVANDHLDIKGDRVPVLVLVNGRIVHGMQFQDDERRDEPTSFYGRTSGVGRAIQYLASRGSLRMGAIGLGTGTLSAYARKNDELVFYEINPQVPLLANQYFSFVRDAKRRMADGDGRVAIVMGDARLSLERELNSRPQPVGYQILVIDAFSGDAIPTHLITREAGDLYRSRLKPHGVLAIHISNRYLNLEPVIRGLAGYLNFTALRISSNADNDAGTQPADWMLLTDNEEFLAALRKYATRPTNPKRLLWTDEYSDLFGILR